MRPRPVVASAAVLAVLWAAPGHAARRPQIVDPRGDVKAGGPSYDVVSATFDTVKQITTRRTNGKVTRTVTPIELLVRLELVDTPKFEPGTSYQVVADTKECGSFFAYAFWSQRHPAGETRMQFTACGEGGIDGGSYSIPTHSAYLSGKAIVWRVSLRDLPKQVRLGAAFNNLEAYTAPADPLNGYTAHDFLLGGAGGLMTFDDATSDEVYRLGS